MLLGTEQRNVALPENPAAAMPVVVRELFKPPASVAHARSFPADTVVRAAYLLPDGTAFVDLGGATLTQGWPAGSHEELMAVYSLVETVMANFPEAKKVRILVNGAPAETTPPPQPVPRVSITRSSTPRPAPARHSPIAAAFASLSNPTGRPNRSRMWSRSGALKRT